MSDAPSPTMRLYDDHGRRLFLTSSERARIVSVTKAQPHSIRALCLCLAYTGCRISEALALKSSDLQADEGVLAILSLKKRWPGHIRELHIPNDLTTLLVSMAEYDRQFWPIAHATAWRQVKAVMREADVAGPQASPKALRHAFAVNAILTTSHL